MKPQEKTISTTVDNETFEEINQACKNCKISIADFLRILVTKALAAAIRGVLKHSNWIYEGEIKRTTHNRIYRVVKKA